MRKLFLAILIAFSATTFAQTPSVSALSFSLDNYGLYNNWHNQGDTFFVVPIISEPLKFSLSSSIILCIGSTRQIFSAIIRLDLLIKIP